MNQTAQRLDALIDRRRLDCGLRWKDVATAVGVTHQTLLEARKGRGLSDLTAAGIERFMEWRSGSVRRVLAGDDPIPALKEDSVPQLAAVDAWDGEIIGPDAPLREGEELRWRDEKRGEKRIRIYELTTHGLSFEAGLGLDSTPEGVIGDLRRTLADRVAQVSGDLLRSHSGS